MKKFDKLLNDLSKYPTSFKNIQNKLQGVHLSDDIVFESDDVITLINYKFNEFIKYNNGTSTLWIIDVSLENGEGEKLEYTVRNQKLLKERAYELLTKVSDINKVFEKINNAK